MTDSKSEWIKQLEKAAEQTLGEILKEIDTPKCFVCDEPASEQKMGRDLCTYHYDLANDHKRGR